MTDRDRLRQNELLTRLLRIARRQAAALQAERLDQFLALTDDRAAIMTELQAVAEGGVPTNVVAFPTHAPGHDEPEVRSANGALLGAILRQDEDNEILLTEQMNRMREAINMLGQGYTTARGYASAQVTRQAGHRIDVAG